MTDSYNRDKIMFYGIDPTYWSETFGAIAGTHYLLTQRYVNEACSVVTISTVSQTTIQFLYPDYLTDRAFIDGRAEGQLTFYASGGASTVTSYRVTICKATVDSATPTELFSTNWITVNKGISSASDMVLPFWINCVGASDKYISNTERLLVKIEVTTTNTYLKLCHDNSATYEDFKIEIPFRL